MNKYDRKNSVEQILYEWEHFYSLAMSVRLTDVEKRPVSDFTLALQTIDESFAKNIEIRISENVRHRISDHTTKLMKLENIVEEFRNYYNRHKAIRQKAVPASCATAEPDPKVDQKSCLYNKIQSFKECYYLNS